jgi:pimeloyl-ACP methyl ester carboxylesterase
VYSLFYCKIEASEKPMNKNYRWFFRRKTWVILLIILFPLSLLSRCVMFRISDEKATKSFQDTTKQPSFHYYQVGNRKMHYAEIGSDTLPMVLFVHGSPGSWNAFISYFKDAALNKVARLVAVDRPGYGYSDFGVAEPSAKKQATLIAEILRLNKSRQRPILVGHSLGGPVIARIAMDYPDLVGGLVFIAPSISPDLEKKEYYRYALEFPLISFFMPKEFDISNREILAFKKGLVKMMPLWKNIRVPATVIQGDKDDLVDPDNANFAKKMLINADKVRVVMLHKVNHFIPWSHPQVVREAILWHLKNSDPY